MFFDVQQPRKKGTTDKHLCFLTMKFVEIAHFSFASKMAIPTEEERKKEIRIKWSDVEKTIYLTCEALSASGVYVLIECALSLSPSPSRFFAVKIVKINDSNARMFGQENARTDKECREMPDLILRLFR